MPARERLTPTEQWLAYLIGLGIALAMGALFFTSLGTIDNSDYTNSLCIVGLAFVVAGIGFWMFLVRPWEAFDDLTTPHYTGHDEHEPAAVEVPEAEAPAIEPAQADDDLTLIEGLGEKTAAALHQAGITTFAQIASMSPETLVETARAHGARISKADTWPAQAMQAAAGNLTGLTDLQDDITAGERYDDLTEIEGIGPKSRDALHAGGIRTFEDLAAATPDAILTALGAAGLNTNLFDPTSWPEQAGYIVRGDLSGLKALQDRLKGGRK